MLKLFTLILSILIIQSVKKMIVENPRVVPKIPPKHSLFKEKKTKINVESSSGEDEIPTLEMKASKNRIKLAEIRKRLEEKSQIYKAKLRSSSEPVIFNYNDHDQINRMFRIEKRFVTSERKKKEKLEKERVARELELEAKRNQRNSDVDMLEPIDSNDLITFGLELESDQIMSTTAEPETDNPDHAYVNSAEWSMFNDNETVIEIATKKGYSLNQIKKIANEIQQMWNTMTLKAAVGKTASYQKGDIIVTVGSTVIKANRDFTYQRFSQIPYLSPQLTVKLPLRKVPNLLNYFMNDTKTSYTIKNIVRSGSTKDIAQMVFNTFGVFPKSGLACLWLFYRYAIFYEKNDDFRKQGEYFLYGPKQMVIILSRIGFYEMYHQMSQDDKDEFFGVYDAYCGATKSICDDLYIMKYKNEESTNHNVINNNLTLRKWTLSIINGRKDFKNQRKLSLTLGENVTVADTDLLSPPLGYRSSLTQSYSDYNESGEDATDRIYGMGCLTDLPKPVHNGEIVEEPMALLELRDYSASLMKGDSILEYLSSELGEIYHAVKDDLLII